MQTFKDLKIVFFGTPGFAVGSLQALVEAGCNIAGVVTAPDKPSGRGLQVHATAVKTYAESVNLMVLQPPKLKNPEFLRELKDLEADLQVVVAFRMLPEVVWDMPGLGTINVHASLLPQYRGAAPINWAIINGETQTGVTTFKLKQEIDTGDILLQQKVPILPEDNAGTLHDKLMDAGATLLVKTVQGFIEDTIKEQPQQDFKSASLKHAPKLFKEMMRINWQMPAVEVVNLIRGLSPYPTAFTDLQQKGLKIFAAHAAIATTGLEPGELETDGKTYLRFAATDGWIYIDELQQEGKKRMMTKDFLRGFRP